MDSILYKAAAEGNIDAFNEYTGRLHLLVTTNENTILHIHVTAQCDETPERTDFVEKILTTCPSLLFQKNAKGEIPLHIAARYGRSETVRVLIEHAKAAQGDLLERGEGGETWRQMLRMSNKEKDTAFHEAVRFNHGEVVELLTKEDPEFPHSCNDSGETPLYLAVERIWFWDTESRLLACRILSNCASPAHGGPNGLTALHAAVINHDEGIAEQIIKKKGATLTKEVDHQGWTPLHYAAYDGGISMVKLLLKYDRSAAYLADRDGKRTPLHIAVGRAFNYDIVEELVSCCPDCCELVDMRGRNILHIAIDNWTNFPYEMSRTIELVLENSSLTNLLNEKDDEGNMPLHRLAVKYHLLKDYDYQMASRLLRHPRVNKMAFNKKNLSVMDIAWDISPLGVDDKMAFKKKNFPDILPDRATLSVEEEKFTRKYRALNDILDAHARPGMRNISYKDENTNYKDDGDRGKDEDNDDLTEIRKASETHLIVATLIATVMFAASFTLPGGYISDKGPDQGTPILARNAAFRAFVISDTIAMLLSSSTVFIYIFLAMPMAKEKLYSYFRLAAWLTILATGAMVVAFMTGLYAVLQRSSPGLAIAICAIACSFFFFYYPLLLKPFATSTRLLHRFFADPLFGLSIPLRDCLINGLFIFQLVFLLLVFLLFNYG